ncbi:hypothetical protein FQN50_008013 [Emmonsiellopsis sp. PD_5]|nr:hypothetical protein FQN50_008013 [Emmonsiellopsis sp. PD_5]
MKIAPLAFLIYTAGSALAYDEYGGYDRLYFYYAYLLDAKLNGGTPRKVATGCKKGGGICDFNEFLKFINDKSSTADVPGLKDKFNPGIDDTVGNKIAEILERIGEFIGGNRAAAKEKAPAEFTNARLAIQRVSFLRAEAYSTNLREKLQDLGANVIDRTKTLTFKDRTKRKTHDFVDIKRTVEQNPGLNLREAIREINIKEEKHLENIEGAKTAHGKFTCK